MPYELHHLFFHSLRLGNSLKSSFAFKVWFWHSDFHQYPFPYPSIPRLLSRDYRHCHPHFLCSFYVPLLHVWLYQWNYSFLSLCCMIFVRCQHFITLLFSQYILAWFTQLLTKEAVVQFFAKITTFELCVLMVPQALTFKCHQMKIKRVLASVTNCYDKNY